MSRDEFDSSSTMYECRVLSRIYFGEILCKYYVTVFFLF